MRNLPQRADTGATRASLAVGGPAAPAVAPSRREGWSAALRKLGRNPTAAAGGAMIVALLLVSLLGPALAGRDPLRLDTAQTLKPPSARYPMGTDQVGRDVFARVLAGGQLSMGVGLGVMLASTLAGLALGLASGYYRRLDDPIMRVMDALMAFPSILFAIVVMGILGPSVGNVVVALSLVSIPRVARVARSSVLVAREEAYVEAARAAGARDGRILVRHILPNTLSPLIMQASYIFASAVLAEAALSFVGVGAPPQSPSWGNILSEGRLVVAQAPWITVFPGVAIVLVVLGANLFGDGLRDALDPRLREA